MEQEIIVSLLYIENTDFLSVFFLFFSEIGVAPSTDRGDIWIEE